MMNVKKNKLNILNIVTAAIITAVLCVSFAASLLLFLSFDFRQYDNTSRILVSKQRNKIEKGLYNQGTYPYVVFDLTGKVVYSEAPFDYAPGDMVNPQEMLQYDKSFANTYSDSVKETFVLMPDGVTTGFAVFLVPEKDVFQNLNAERAVTIFAPMLGGILVSILLLAIKVIYCKKRIFTSLEEVSASAKAIINGNYDIEVIRTYWKKVDENEVGDLIYAFELMRDELKSKQLKEEMLKKSQQELISCISHDLKTPLSTIKAYGEGLRDNIAKSPEQRAEYVNIIISKTNLLIGMISELLEYSNAQLNQLEINREEVYFLGYFTPLMDEIRVFAEHYGMAFTFEAAMSDRIVSIDRRRITEVIYNLIENSMKYANETNGKITVTVENSDTCVLIKVQDNGIGISYNDIPYVFDRFYRAEKSRSTSIPGSGLGLSICKYIVEAHDGEIYCKSLNNQGCEIGFTLT